jgi:hypothetical protein
MSDPTSHLPEAFPLSDEDSFRRIFEEHYGRVFRFFVARGFPHEEAMDTGEVALEEKWLSGAGVWELEVISDRLLAEEYTCHTCHARLDR